MSHICPGAGSGGAIAHGGGRVQRHGPANLARLGASLQRRRHKGFEVPSLLWPDAGFKRAMGGRVARVRDQGTRSGDGRGGPLAVRGTAGPGGNIASQFFRPLVAARGRRVQSKKRRKRGRRATTARAGDASAGHCQTKPGVRIWGLLARGGDVWRAKTAADISRCRRSARTGRSQ